MKIKIILLSIILIISSFSFGEDTLEAIPLTIEAPQTNQPIINSNEFPPRTSTHITQSLPPLESFSTFSTIYSLTFSKNNKAYVLGSSSKATEKFVFYFEESQWKKLLHADGFLRIHAATDNDLLILSRNSFVHRELSTEQSTLFLKTKFRNKKHPLYRKYEYLSNFGLEQDDALIRVSGKSIDQLWITYQKADNSFKTRLFAIHDNQLSIQKEERDYRSITIGNDESIWALHSNRTTLSQLSVFGSGKKNIDDIDIDEDETFVLTSPLSSITARDKKYMYGLNDKGVIYQWAPDKKQFFPIELPQSMPQENYTSIIAATNGPVYAINKDGKIYTPLTPVSTIARAAQPKPMPQSEPTKSIEFTAPTIEEIEAAAQTSAPKKGLSVILEPIKESSMIKKTTQPSAVNMQRPPINEPPIQKFAPIKQQEENTQPQTAPKEWQAINQQRYDPNFEAGFNAGLMAGIQANEAYNELLNELRPSYEKGVADGAKGCVIDTVFWQMMDILTQEGKKTFYEKLQSSPLDIFKGFLQ